jgi:DNA modification methylase
MNINRECAEVLTSVLATGQKPSRIQRRGRYLPDSMKHPGKMLPAIAARVIQAYTEPGDLVIDPMCGIGTTLLEAIHLDRQAAGMEYEGKWVELAAANLLHARRHGATGTAKLALGDARTIAGVFSEHRGQVALVVTSPPYGASTHGHVRSTRDSGQDGVRKWNTHYSDDRGNLAYQSLDELLAGFGEILTGCAGLLRPGGVVAITVRPFRVQGELVDLPGRVIEVAEQAGLVLTDRLVALLCGLRDGRLVNRASFFQMLETRRARQKGLPVCATAHEDLLVLSTGMGAAR